MFGCLTCFYSEKFNGSNFHLQIIAKTKRNHFLNGSLETMKNGSCTTIMYEKDRNRSKASEAPQIMAKPGLTPRKDALCVCVCVCVCVCGGIGKELFTSCCHTPGQTIDSNLYYQQLKRLR